MRQLAFFILICPRFITFILCYRIKGLCYYTATYTSAIHSTTTKTITTTNTTTILRKTTISSPIV